MRPRGLLHGRAQVETGGAAGQGAGVQGKLPGHGLAGEHQPVGRAAAVGVDRAVVDNGCAHSQVRLVDGRHDAGEGVLALADVDGVRFLAHPQAERARAEQGVAAAGHPCAHRFLHPGERHHLDLVAGAGHRVARGRGSEELFGAERGRPLEQGVPVVQVLDRVGKRFEPRVQFGEGLEPVVQPGLVRLQPGERLALDVHQLVDDRTGVQPGGQAAELNAHDCVLRAQLTVSTRLPLSSSRCLLNSSNSSWGICRITSSVSLSTILTTKEFEPLSRSKRTE